MVLQVIKVVHTMMWAFFVLCILALPIAAVFGRFDWALTLIALVLVETTVLAVNRGRCPLTDLAARYTEDRSDNFDIYLPRWIARNNKVVFGSLFIAGALIVLWLWLNWLDVQPAIR